MTEEAKPAEGAIPPRITLKPSDVSGNGGAPESETKKTTTRVESALAVPETPPALKKKTSRIPLEQVSAETGARPGATVTPAGLLSKTMRLAPATPPPPSISIPSQGPVTRVMTGARASDEVKRQTSRISLETVLSEKPTMGGDAQTSPGAPKTIRIKRPTSGLAGTGSPTVSAPAVGAVSPAKSTTARIELAEEGVTEGQQTQRKTIKIRRADGGTVARGAPRSVSVARLEAQAAERRAEELADGSTHFLFPVAAAVALVVMGVMLYVLAVQAFPDAHLSFPGKLTL